MKLKCVDNAEGRIDLTIGKEYKVIGESKLMGEKAYIVNNDYKSWCEKPTPLGVGWIAKYFIINCVQKC